MKILYVLIAVSTIGCSNTTLVVPVGGPVRVEIKGKTDDDCKPVIVNGIPQSGCVEQVGMNQ